MSNLGTNSRESPLIFQFGTSRFLQAHVDYFIGCSIAAQKSSAKIVVVQTSGSSAGKARVRAMNEMTSYPVRIRGLSKGQIIDQEEHIASIAGALQADHDWPQVIELFCNQVGHVVSNTGDQGYSLDEKDDSLAQPPNSFPAKLLILLLARYSRNGRGVTIMPCELVANNGDVLKEIVVSLAQKWALDKEFIGWVKTDCLWVNSLGG